MKKLVVFYSIFFLIQTAYALLTFFFWESDFDIESSDEFGIVWKLNFARVIPVTIIGTFGLFNIWIQCFNKQISR